MMYLQNIGNVVQQKLSKLSLKQQLASTAVLGAMVGVAGTMISYPELSHDGISDGQSFYVQSVDDAVDGSCGSAHKNTLFSPVTLTTPGLCKSGQESHLILEDKNKPYKATWDCVGSVGMKTESCEAKLIVMSEPKKESKKEAKPVDKVLQAWKDLFNK